MARVNYNKAIGWRDYTARVARGKAVRVMDVAFIGKLIICILSFVQVGLCAALVYATRPKKKSDKKGDDRSNRLDD